MMVLLKYLSNFWRTIKMPLANCEINLDLNWSQKCVIVATEVSNLAATFLITDTNLYIPVVTSSTQDNEKLLQQLKSGFKITIDWNKDKPKIPAERPNQYLDYFINSSFQGVNGLFVLLFENNAHRTSYK